MGTSFKGRICSHRERILSFKSSSLWYDKSLLQPRVTSLECYYFNTHVRNCVMGARPVKYNLWCVNIHCQSFIFDPLANIEDRDVLLPAENTARIQNVNSCHKSRFTKNCLLNRIEFKRRSSLNRICIVSFKDF